MQSFDTFKNNQSVLVYFLLSFVISVVASFGFAVLFALIMTYFSVSPEFSALFSTLSYIFGCFISGVFLGYKIKSKGMLFGAGLGLAVFLFSIIIGLIVNKSSFSLITVFHLTSCVLSGAVGGILSVNRVSSKHYKLGKYK